MYRNINQLCSTCNYPSVCRSCSHDGRHFRQHSFCDRYSDNLFNGIAKCQDDRSDLVRKLIGLPPSHLNDKFVRNSFEKCLEDNSYLMRELVVRLPSSFKETRADTIARGNLNEGRSDPYSIRNSDADVTDTSDTAGTVNCSLKRMNVGMDGHSSTSTDARRLDVQMNSGNAPRGYHGEVDLTTAADENGSCEMGLLTSDQNGYLTRVGGSNEEICLLPQNPPCKNDYIQEGNNDVMVVQSPNESQCSTMDHDSDTTHFKALKTATDLNVIEDAQNQLDEDRQDEDYSGPHDAGRSGLGDHMIPFARFLGSDSAGTYEKGLRQERIREPVSTDAPLPQGIQQESLNKQGTSASFGELDGVTGCNPGTQSLDNRAQSLYSAGETSTSFGELDGVTGCNPGTQSLDNRAQSLYSAGEIRYPPEDKLDEPYLSYSTMKSSLEDTEALSEDQGGSSSDADRLTDDSTLNLLPGYERPDSKAHRTYPDNDEDVAQKKQEYQTDPFDLITVKQTVQLDTSHREKIASCLEARPLDEISDIQDQIGVERITECKGMHIRNELLFKDDELLLNSGHSMCDTESTNSNLSELKQTKMSQSQDGSKVDLVDVEEWHGPIDADTPPLRGQQDPSTPTGMNDLSMPTERKETQTPIHQLFDMEWGVHGHDYSPGCSEEENQSYVQDDYSKDYNIYGDHDCL